MKYFSTLVLGFCVSFSLSLFAQDDEFNSTNIGTQWSFVRADSSMVYLTGTALQIRTQPGALNGIPPKDGPTNSVKNIVLQPSPSGTFRMETRLVFKPDSSFHNAGLIYYINDDNYVRLSRGVFGITNGLWMEWEVDGNPELAFVDQVAVASVYLRLSRTNGSIFSGSYSLNGTSWLPVATRTINFGSSLPAPRIGLQAANGIGITATEVSIPAQFDYFRFLLTDIHDESVNLPYEIEFHSISPNPYVVSNAHVNAIQLRYTLNKASRVSYSVLDIHGREVHRMSLQHQDAGVHSEQIALREMSAGIYFIRLTTPSRSVMQRFVVVE